MEIQKPKSPAGRKPIADKKVATPILVRQSIVDKFGGKNFVQEFCYNKIGQELGIKLD